MTGLRNLAAKRREASDAPWVVEHGSIAWMIRERTGGPQVGNVICEEDAVYIAAAGNVSADQLDALADVVEAARTINASVSGNHDTMASHDHSRCLPSSIELVRAALDRLDAER